MAVKEGFVKEFLPHLPRRDNIPELDLFGEPR
jgi:hypothetical protein